MAKTNKPKKNSYSRSELGTYYSASQLRMDIWNRLKLASQRLQEGTETAHWREEVADFITILDCLEVYWAFPGKAVLRHIKGQFDRRAYSLLAPTVANVVRLLVSESYRQIRSFSPSELTHIDDLANLSKMGGAGNNHLPEHYFEVLFVDLLSTADQTQLRRRMLELSDEEEQFSYDIVLAPSFADALIAIMFNPHIQSCVIRYNFPIRSSNNLHLIQQYISNVINLELEDADEADLAPAVGHRIKKPAPRTGSVLGHRRPGRRYPRPGTRAFRPHFFTVRKTTSSSISALKGAYRNALKPPSSLPLKTTASAPTGVFHAMPISRGNSVFKSHWIQDMGEFYGRNVFLAETSATTGGLDSLLQPRGPLKKAQELAARAFGSRQTFFVTNGTSTSNKVVLQALIQPDDIVLIDRDCHKSHHYALVLSGAYPVYLESYPLEEYFDVRRRTLKRNQGQIARTKTGRPP